MEPTIEIKEEPQTQHGVKKVSSSKQFRAMFVKNLRLQKRQRCTNACQLIVPIIVTILVGSLNIVVQNLLKGRSQEGQIITSEPLPIYLGPVSYVSNDMGYYGYVSNVDVGALYMNGSKYGMLGLIPQTSIPGGNEHKPYFVKYDSQNSVDERILSERGYRNSLGTVESMNFQPSFEHSYPNGVVVFNEISASSTGGGAVMDVTIMVNNQSSSSQRFGRNFMTVELPDMQRMLTRLLVTNAFLNYVLEAYMLVQVYMQTMYYKATALNIDIGSALGGSMFGLALSFLLPVFVSSLVYEKQDRLKEMMKMVGMRVTVYWAIMWVYYIIIYIVVALIVCLLGLAFQLRFFTQTSGGIMLLLLGGWGLSQVGLGFLLSTFFDKTKSANIVSYMLVIAAILAGMVINSTLYRDTEANGGFLIYPTFAFYRGMYLIGQACSANACMQTVSNEMGRVLAVLWIEGIGLMVIARYFDDVLPKQYGLRKKPLYFLDFSNKNRNYDEAINTQQDTIDEFMDDDVKTERENIMKNNISNDALVIMKNLRKVYPPTEPKQSAKLAVVDLCLSLKSKECFGMLGPNGSGKTTTISMLTGLYPPTGGTAVINGFDIRHHMDEIHTIMGICPQFDTLWMDLTARETLMFFAEMKGLDPSSAAANADESLGHVGLLQSKDKLVSELSGGMRRRLSVAVSICGNPKFILLDEPTTGLDPESRRQLWDILLRVRENHCIILTTHSMEEADVLCTRIGIMSKGELKCLGPNLHLKNKFGQGYVLKVSFDSDHESSVTGFVKENWPSATLSESFPGYHSYTIPRTQIVMSQLFTTMTANSSKYGIIDWGISQTSLEEVFLRIAKDDDTVQKD